MSKQNPNQDYYKIGGRSQSEGPDRSHANVNADTHELAQNEKDASHPAIKRAAKKK